MQLTIGGAWRAYEPCFLGIDAARSEGAPEDRPWYVRHDDRMLGDAELPALVEDLGSRAIPGLSLAGCRRLTDAGISAVVAALPELSHLDLFNTRATDATVHRLAGMSRLRTLNLAGTSVSDACVESLARLPGLVNLHLGWTQISSTGLRLIAKLPSLEALALRNTLVDDAGLEHLAAARRLTLLSLQSTSVGDAGVKNLVPAASRLQFLDLSYTHVTEASVATLARFVELRTLGLRAVAVGRGSDAHLRRALVHLPIAGTSDGGRPQGLFH